MVSIKKILYPTDFSTYSNQAYFHAIALAETYGASLTILHVYTPRVAAIAVAPDGMPPAVSEAADDRAHWQEQLEQIRPLNSDVSADHVMLEGDPAEEIIDYANNGNIDLIVMGTHGRTGLERLLLGSVAEKVLRGARCSVLVAKLPKRTAHNGSERAAQQARSATVRQTTRSG
jgi:nucleotide-binding universal stress UspA family protein